MGTGADSGIPQPRKTEEVAGETAVPRPGHEVHEGCGQRSKACGNPSPKDNVPGAEHECLRGAVHSERRTRMPGSFRGAGRAALQSPGWLLAGALPHRAAAPSQRERAARVAVGAVKNTPTAIE